jgi:hypothetical protein
MTLFLRCALICTAVVLSGCALAPGVNNVCRSPDAAALLAHELPGKTIRSADLAAPVGAPTDPMTSAEIARTCAAIDQVLREANA